MHNIHICTYPYTCMAQAVKNLPAIQETQVQILGQEAPLERRKWQPTPVCLPGKSHGQKSLSGYSPWGRKESDMTEHTCACMCMHMYTHTHIHAIIYTHTFVHKPRYKLVRGHSPQKQLPERGKSQDIICFGICNSHVEISLSKGKHKDSWVTKQTPSCPS